MFTLIILAQSTLPATLPVWTIDRILTLGANAALVVGLLLNARQLRLVRQQLQDTDYATKMNRTLDFCHRCNDLQFANYRRGVYDLLETDPKLHDLLDRIEQDRDFKAALRFVLNFYEELGLAYNKREVDQPTIKSFYSAQVEFLYKHTSPYIQHMRGTYAEDLWQQFTTMREHLKKQPD